MSTLRTITTTGSGPLENPDGTALANVAIPFTLVDINGIPTYGFETVGNEGIFDKAEATTDSNGDFSISLYPNDEITGDTYYLVDMTGVAGYSTFKAKLAAGVGSISFYDFYVSGATPTPAEVSALTAHIQDNAIHSATSVGSFVNLKTQTNDTNPTYQVDVAADNLTLTDTNGLPLQATSVSVTGDITATGANGRDVAVAEKVSEHYALYVIGKADGTIASLLKQWTETGTATATTVKKLIDSGGSFDADGLIEVGDKVINQTDGTSTTVSAIDSDTTLSVVDDIFASGEAYRIVLDRAPTLPTDYLYKRRVGSAYNNASGDFRLFNQHGALVYLVAYDIFLVGGTATSLALITPEAPPNASEITMSVINGSLSHLNLSLDGVNVSMLATNTGGFYFQVTTGLNATQQIHYMSTSGSGSFTMLLTGYRDNL